MPNVSGGAVIWDLDVDSGKLTQGLSDAKNQAATTADQIDKSMEGVKNSTKSAGEAFKEFANSAVMGATVITGALSLIAKGAIDLGTDYQSARISFETFLKSGEKAGKLLSDLGEFAAKTPFDLPQVVDGTKRLLAYGIAANDIIPTFKMLGDLSSGNKLKLDQLTLAYGQVKAATKLTGAELRQFTEAGIPLLDALAAEFNKNGGAMVKVGGAAKKTKVDVGELNDKLGIAKKRLEEATKAGKAKESTMMSLKNTVQNYEQKLGEVNKTSAGTAAAFKKVKVSAADVKDMISDGGVTFENVNAALAKLTASGGMFFNNMESQSKSFGGVMSNIGDEIKRFTLESLGFFISGDNAGTVRTGSIFFFLQQAAEKFLGALQAIRPIASAFVDSFLKNQTAMAGALGVLLGLLTPLAIAFVTMIAPAIAFAAAGAAIAVVVYKIIEAMGGFEAVKSKLIDAFKGIQDGFKGIKKTFETDMATWGPLFQGYIDIFAGQFKALGERMYDSLKLDPSKMSITDFFTQVIALVMPEIARLGTNIKQGFANVFKFEGGGGGFADFIGNMLSLFTQVSDILLRVLTPAWNTLTESLKTSQPAFDYLAQQVGPLLINSLKLIAGVVAVLIVAFAGLLSGIVSAFSMALPFIITAMGGIVEVINGALNIIVGLFTLNWGQVLQGTKDLFSGMWNFIAGGITAIVALIAGFVKGVVDFFKNLYDVLVGHSIIPDMVNAIIDWFMKLPGQIFGILSKLLTDVKDWGERIARSFVDGFSKIGDWLKEKVQAGLDKAKASLEGHSPPKEGPFQNIDTWGYNVGNAWVGGIKSAISDFSMNDIPLSTSMDAPRGSGVLAAGGNNSGGKTQTIYVSIGKVENAQDIDQITREIGFRASLLPAS